MSNRPCYCGATEGVRVFMNGPACPAHTPAALAGHPEPPIPDPESTLVGRMRAAGVDVTRAYTPAAETNIDARNRATGKKRASTAQVRNARAQLDHGHQSTRPARAHARTDGPVHGETATEFDADRLNGQRRAVWTAMADGHWLTIEQIAERAGAGPASYAALSARVRDFRKPEFGGHDVERREVRAGVWEYRLLVATPAAAAASSTGLDLGL